MLIVFLMVGASFAIAACFATYARANGPDASQSVAAAEPSAPTTSSSSASSPLSTPLPDSTPTAKPTATVTPIPSPSQPVADEQQHDEEGSARIDAPAVATAEGLSALLALTVTRPLTVSTGLSGTIWTTATQAGARPINADDTRSEIAAPSMAVGESGETTVLLPTPTPAPLTAPAPTPDSVTRIVQTPILMYHYVSVPPADADIYRRDLSVPPDLFAQHLDRITADGYTAITLYDFLNHLTYGEPLPEKPVIITFDDGYRDNYQNAFPLLAERNMTATFFVVTDFIDEERPEYLTWEMLREMYAANMPIESHGRNHVSLKDKDVDYLVWQALGSFEAIERELGQRPRFVSYPAGQYDQNTLDLFKSANYWAGLTTVQGATHDSDNLFELRRVRVRGATTPDELSRLLALDW